MQTQANPTTLLITGAVILVVLALRILRSRQARPLRLNMIWIGPALVLVMGGAGAVFLAGRAAPYDPRSIAALLGALIGGGLLGWLRSRTVHIRVDAETRSVTAQGTNLSLVFLLAFLASRFALKFVLMNQDPLSSIMMKVNLGYILFAIGAICIGALELTTRAHRLLAQGKTAD